MDFGGIIAGALGGGAKAAGEVAQGNIDAAHRADLAQQTADIELQKMKAAKDYGIESDNAVRQARADRINTGAQGIIASQQGQRLDNFYNADLQPGQAPSDLAHDPSGISDEEKSQVQPSDRDLSLARLSAAAQSGDLDPNQEATTNSRTMAIEGQNQRLLDKLDSYEKTSAERTAASLDRNAAFRERTELTSSDRNAALQLKLDPRTVAADPQKALSSVNTAILGMENGSHGSTPDAKKEWSQQHDMAIKLRASIMQRIQGKVDGTDPIASTSGAPGTIPRATPPAGSGNPRKDVADASKLWNDQGN